MEGLEGTLVGPLWELGGSQGGEWGEPGKLLASGVGLESWPLSARWTPWGSLTRSRLPASMQAVSWLAGWQAAAMHSSWPNPSKCKGRQLHSFQPSSGLGWYWASE